MGYNNEYGTSDRVIVVDIETAGLPNAADFLEPVQPARNLKDPEKIAADIAQRTADRDSKLALDWNVGRVVALGWWTEYGGEMWLCRDDDDERAALAELWSECRHRTIVGFNIKGFDLKFMVQRSRYLGVSHPILDLGKYTRKGIVDLFSELTFNDGTYDQGAMRRTLHAFCRRFGIPVDDTTIGADVPALVAAGEWDRVAEHCASDLRLTVQLGQRLGVVPQDAPVAI